MYAMVFYAPLGYNACSSVSSIFSFFAFSVFFFLFLAFVLLKIKVKMPCNVHSLPYKRGMNACHYLLMPATG